MTSLEGISGETSRTSMWSVFFRSWMGLLLVTGILLFGITGRIQFSCNPMVTGGDLPGFCSSTEIVENASNRPTHFEPIFKAAADPHQNVNILRKIDQINGIQKPIPIVDDNPRILEYALARNPNTPESTLLRLSGSDDLEVLTGLLSNKSATSNSRVMERLCNNSLVKQELKTCYSPPPPSCRKNHARNIAVGLGLGLLTFIAAPVLLPAEAVVAPFAAGLLGGASAFGTSAGLLELFTKC